MNHSQNISGILKPLAEKKLQAYISSNLQVADILEWIIAQFSNNGGNDKIHVMQSTFSISEEFLRRMYFIKKDHPCFLSVIIDRKALQKTVSLWKFVSKVYDEVFLADNHSKVLIFDGGHDKRAAVVTSQNLTRGNRAESAVVTTEPDVFFPLRNDFLDIRNNKSIPMHEIMPLPDSESQDTQQSLENEVERLAEIFLPVSDMAVILGVPENMLREEISVTDSPIGIAYARGKAKAKVALKAQEMQLARVGSPLAMQAVRENLLAMENDEF